MPAHRSVRRLLAIAAVLTAASLALPACGGDDEPSLTTPGVDAADATDSGAEIEPGDDTTTTDGAETDGATEADGTTTDGVDEVETPGPSVPTPTPATVSGPATFGEFSKLTTVGLADIFFGDPVGVAARKADTEWIGIPARGSRPQCYTVQPSGGPVGTVFTVLDGRIERVDIADPIITTRSGLGVGSTEAVFTELFGDQIETRRVDGGNELIFVPTDETDQDFRIIWTTDGTTTNAMRAGRVPGILDASPCS